MTVTLPASMQVLERGWLSANNILFFDGNQATLVDSGYVAHARQTVELVQHSLAGRQLSRLINTHSHSDHIGGNAALKAAFDCEIIVPAGLHAVIADWDEDALLLSPLGQQSARFQHDSLIGAGNELEMGGLNWQALAVPGHDMEALAYYNPEQRILISGDALWENGFGVIFPELLGEADGLASTQATLEMLSQLAIDTVIPGHGRPFSTVDAAFERAFRRLNQFQNNIEQLAWHAIKVIVAFAMMEKRRIPKHDFPAFVLALPFALDVNTRFLNMADDALVAKVERELLLVNALRLENGMLAAG
ncbi:MBL fold metallo-hydrolase [Ferribacterium limneticum]|uniref:MBL fold metallo-hydrolase n=1 Tax=Ferribacterium limneticum TaxID=76259 RepID=UPI001CFAF150|nr:MBL fold metallo-hydrolase [Ferribacterium limneticum]UCV28625.1 MBL fold metallo-hydrolase [Ferribacterium limneticum]UCV32542.1 MBL fold metallo-hydrolase [Ferribacterium limneticum]